MARPFDDSPIQLDRIIHSHWVGRRREMDEAISLWQGAVSGEGNVLLISGEPGVGKTRFVRELVSTVRLAGAILLTGECYAEGSAPYAPVTQMLRQLFEVAPHNDFGIPKEILLELLPIMPALKSRLGGVLPRQNLDPQAEQQRILEAFVTFCASLSSQGPLFLFIDDIHWADTGTLFLLRNLARYGRSLPLLIVATYREAELDSAPILNEVLVDLNRERLALQFKLERLSRDESYELLAAMFADAVTPEFLDSIFQQTEGNPFFMEEVCKSLIEAGQLSWRDGLWRHPVMADIKIPHTIRAAIQARLQKLPVTTQDVLRMAAILGGDFDFEALRRACDLDEETIIEGLENAVRVQLIAEVQTGQAKSLRFSFVHSLIPTTLRESIIHVRRRRLHLRAAQAIEAVHPDDFEALAYHFTEAGEVERARQFHVRAGDRAQRAAPGEAMRFYQAALDLWPEGNQAGRAEILAQLGYCNWVIGDVQASLKAYETAYTLFEALGNRAQSGEMQRMIGRMYWERADRALATQHYFQALAVLEQGPETVELARAISSISQMYMLAPEEDQAIAWGERALAMAKGLGAEDVVIHALNNIGAAYAQYGEFEKGLSILHESLQRALAADLPLDVCRAYYNVGVMLQRQCRYEKARTAFVELNAYSIKVYAKNYSNLSLWRLMWIDWLRGHWSAALALRSRMVGFNNSLYTVWANRGFSMIDLDLGRIEDAGRILEESLPSALGANDLQTTVPHLGLLAKAYEALGQESKIEGIINQVLGYISGTTYITSECVMPLFIAGHWLAAQNNPGFREHLNTCLSQLERHENQYHTEEAAAALFETQGTVLLTGDHPLEAAEHFRQAAANWQAIGRLYDQARALGAMGRALKKSGFTTDAGDLNKQAVTIFNTLAAQLEPELQALFLDSPAVREVRQASTDLSLKMPRKVARQEFNALTEREIEVLKLVAQGLTNAQIAERLILSPLTVNAHLRSIFNKLDVTTRTAAVRQAAERKLISQF